ncbi:tetratricopeptide repeat protein [Flammeovirgaceae bacterium SG7u.111]|nr:tetratricopeptide repeat protein [Flammeovirgaceae bacterium SG7u.132]WPO33189.1 tetratricopeptide repeat protein [Flammeovirgaceae bacterium SG7u.111]
MRNLTTSFLLIVLMSNLAIGQNTLLDTEPDKHYYDALELLDKKKYASAMHRFEDYLQAGDNQEKKIHSEFYTGLCALKLGNPNFEEILMDFIKKNPAHPKRKSAYFLLGGYYFNEADFKKSIELYESANIEAIEDDKDVEAAFHLAYSYLTTGNNQRAQQLFNQIKAGDHKYLFLSNYYAGYLNYEAGNYEAALSDLELASKDVKLREQTYELIPSIQYKFFKYDEVLAFVQKVENEGRPLPPALNLLAGECYFRKGDYTKAGKYFEQYLSTSKNPEDRIVNYRIGYAYLKNSQPAKAESFLSKAADGQDSLAQAAAYHVGITQVQIDKKQDALLAFEACRKMEYDNILRELGAYYFVKVSADVGDFTAAINGADYYFSLFSNGRNAEEVYQISSEAYLNTGNYTKALANIERINNKNYRVQSAYQQIAFNKAVQDYNDENYRDAVESLNKSLTYPVDPTTAGAANFWLGEIYSVGNKYDSALLFYEKISLSAPEYRESLYGKAYVYYNKKDYASALQFFDQYLKANPSPDKLNDAVIRLADCYYVAKNYNDALRNYDFALNNQPDEPDYVYFQRGLIFKALNQLNKSVGNFDAVVTQFNDSRFADQSLYQKAEIYFQNGRRDEAIAIQTRLIEQFPQSPLIPYTLAKRALASSMTGQFDVAVNDYKKIIDEHITIQSLAETALESLQEINAKGHPVSELDAYIAKFAATYAQSPALVKSNFQAALVPFNSDNFQSAILSLSSFISSNPQTTFTDEAYYKLGFSYEMIGDVENAIKHYLLADGDFKERSIRTAADLELERKNYTESIQHFLQLKAITRKKKYLEQATMSLMKAYYEVKDLEAVSIYANEIQQQNMTRYLNVAELYKGKIFLDQEQYGMAIAQFQKTIAMKDDKHSAEAQYLIGKAKRGQEKYQESINELIKVKKEHETYTDWIYEAFLLLSDNYVSLDNAFQAKATLNSIIEYAQDPAVVERAKKRLEEID